MCMPGFVPLISIELLLLSRLRVVVAEYSERVMGNRCGDWRKYDDDSSPSAYTTGSPTKVVASAAAVNPL